MKKRLSYTIDGLLIAFIGILGYTQISMMLTRNSNYGVPKAFGLSFLYIATSSMEILDDPNSLGIGTGIVIASANPETLTPSTPSEYEKDEEGNELYFKVNTDGAFIDKDGNKTTSRSEYILSNKDDPNAKRRIIDYALDGDIVTFYDKGLEYPAPNTHRLIDKRFDEDSQKWYLKTMGDNPQIHKTFRNYPETENKNTVQVWESSYLIGKTIMYSKALGEFLVISSPAIAQTAFVRNEDGTWAKDENGNLIRRQAWLLPVVIIVFVVGFIIYYMSKTIYRLLKESKARDLMIENAMIAAGVDMTNEEEVELFRAKEEIRLDIKQQMEQELENARESIRRIKEKALKEARKEMKKQNIKPTETKK